jgi:prepilin-type N-terminal cleavage/methylation domain-containing protein
MAGSQSLLKMQKGFTIPELLVVFAIMVLMTGIMLPVWRSGDRNLSLDRAVHKAGQDVRRAQELAMRAQSYMCASGSIFAYGVYFDASTPTSYILFAECNSGSIGYNAGQDGIVETLQVESGAKIATVSPTSQISIVFAPPTPAVFLKPGDPLAAQISFERIDGGTSKILSVNSKGVIDID